MERRDWLATAVPEPFNRTQEELRVTPRPAQGCRPAGRRRGMPGSDCRANRKSREIRKTSQVAKRKPCTVTVLAGAETSSAGRVTRLPWPAVKSKAKCEPRTGVATATPVAVNNSRTKYSHSHRKSVHFHVRLAATACRLNVEGARKAAKSGAVSPAILRNCRLSPSRDVRTTVSVSVACARPDPDAPADEPPHITLEAAAEPFRPGI